MNNKDKEKLCRKHYFNQVEINNNIISSKKKTSKASSNWEPLETDKDYSVKDLKIQ